MGPLLVFFSSFLIIVNAELMQDYRRSDGRISQKECAVDAEVRMDCGYYGITESQCYARDCCWGESNLPGVPWCYHSISQSQEVCSMHEDERVDCGYYGIQSRECVAAGCCWRPSQTSNVPWCFFSTDPLIVDGACGSPAMNPSVIGRIIGGEDALPHSWPWQVSFDDGGELGHFCGGALIAPRWIVTAAHCTVPFNNPSTKVRLGVHNKEDSESTVVEARIEAYFEGDYDYMEGMDNDIALVKLDQDIEYTPAISPVCLPRAHEELAAGTECYTSGWGAINFAPESPDILQQALIPVLDRNYCNTSREFYEGLITENMVCAGFEDGHTSSCWGDSGGPFVCSDQGHWVLYGAVSWGQYCENWVLYTRVSNYIDWIERTMAENS